MDPMISQQFMSTCIIDKSSGGLQSPTTPIATRKEIKLKDRNGATWYKYAHFHGKYRNKENQEALIRNQLSSIHNLEVQVGKLLACSLQEHKDRYQATTIKFQKSKYMRLL